ncbi:MAG: DMT family transporter [Bryobacteraceae bacterium]|nr:DMT family transporter [Bryobacteraceae bacterium]
MRRYADLTLAVIAAIWGTTFVIVKEAIADAPAAMFLAVRFTLAAAVLALVLLPQREKIRRAAGGSWRWGTTAGIFLGAGYLLQTWGLASTTASRSAFLTSLYIVLVPFAGALVYRNVPRWREVLGAMVATGGMAAMSWQGETLSLNRGDWLTVGCAVVFAGHILSVGKAAEFGDTALVSLLQIVVSAVIFWGLLGGTGLETAWRETRWTSALVRAIVVTGVGATALTFVLQTWAQQYTTPVRASLLFSLEPVFGALTAWLWAGETLGMTGLAGAALILAGIFIVELKPAEAGGHPSS